MPQHTPESEFGFDFCGDPEAALLLAEGRAGIERASPGVHLLRPLDVGLAHVALGEHATRFDTARRSLGVARLLERRERLREIAGHAVPAPPLLSQQVAGAAFRGITAGSQVLRRLGGVFGAPPGR